MRRNTFLITLSSVAMLTNSGMAQIGDVGTPDTLRLVAATRDVTTVSVSVEVHNDEELAGLDIPLRFGQPGDAIKLDRVDWSNRVDGWEVRHAAIDNEKKTVTLGLISELTRTRPNPDLDVASAGSTQIATLVFSIQGDARPSFETFTTENPGHALTFYYNRYESGKPHLEEFTPEFQVSLDDW